MLCTTPFTLTRNTRYIRKRPAVETVRPVRRRVCTRRAEREGEAAAFLANALAGTQDPWIYGVDSRVDLASFSAQIAEPGSGGQASCTPAHDHIRCVLSRADGYGYVFPMEETASGDWVVRPDNVRLLDYS